MCEYPKTKMYRPRQIGDGDVAYNSHEQEVQRNDLVQLVHRLQYRLQIRRLHSHLYVRLGCVQWLRIMCRYSVLYDTTLRYPTLHDTTLHCTTLLYTTILPYATLRYTALHYVRYATLHYTKRVSRGPW